MVTSYSGFFTVPPVNCYQLSSPIAIFPSILILSLSPFLFSLLTRPSFSFHETLIFSAPCSPFVLPFRPFALLLLFSPLHSLLTLCSLLPTFCSPVLQTSSLLFLSLGIQFFSYFRAPFLSFISFFPSRARRSRGRRKWNV